MTFHIRADSNIDRFRVASAVEAESDVAPKKRIAVKLPLTEYVVSLVFCFVVRFFIERFVCRKNCRIVEREASCCKLFRSCFVVGSRNPSALQIHASTYIGLSLSVFSEIGFASNSSGEKRGRTTTEQWQNWSIFECRNRFTINHTFSTRTTSTSRSGRCVHQSIWIQIGNRRLLQCEIWQRRRLSTLTKMKSQTRTSQVQTKQKMNRVIKDVHVYFVPDPPFLIDVINHSAYPT